MGLFNKLKALLIRAGLELSSWDSIIYFVVKRLYDSILTLILKKVNFLFNISLVQELLLSCLIVFYGRLYLACKLVYKLYHITLFLLHLALLVHRY